MNPNKVVIIGAGLAGLSMAAKLHKSGVQVKLFERRQVIAEQGYSLSIKDRGMKALSEITSIEEMTKFASSIDRFLIVNTFGKTLMDLKPSGSSNKHWQVPRKDLHSLLLKSVPSSLISWDKEFSSYKRADNGRLLVSFSDGSTEECAVLVGADGYRAKIREQLLGDHVQYSGVSQISGAMEGSIEGEPSSTMILAKDKPHGLMTFNQHNRYAWVYMFKSPEEGLNAMKELNSSQLVQHVIKQVSDWPAFDKTRLEKQQMNVTLRGYYYHPPTSLHALFDDKCRSKWPTDPVILIGDAAHAMTPMQGEGGNCAIEDGVRVGEALARALQSNMSHEDLLAAIRTMHKDVHDRTANAVNRSAHAASFFFIDGKWKAWARDWAMYSFHLLIKAMNLFRK